MARRLALLAEEWDTAKAAGAKDAGQSQGHVPVGGEWPWNPPTRVAGSSEPAPSAPVVAVAPISLIPHTEILTSQCPSDETQAGAPLEEQPPPLVRAPGRHAARRGPQRLLAGAASAAAARLGSPLTGVRARLSVAHLTWVAVLVAVSLGLTCWWLVAAKESALLTPVSATLADSEAEASPTREKASDLDAAPEMEGAPDGPGTGAARPGGGEEVVVDVAGKVRRPGIVVLPTGARVVDAIEAAGGAKRGVDLTSLNLARRLLDGEQILVGKVAATGVGAAPPSGAHSSSSGALVNLNSAGQTELETLPGVGPVTAAAIVEWRTRHGGFTSVEDLLEVDGIGEATLRRLAPLVSV